MLIAPISKPWRSLLFGSITSLVWGCAATPETPVQDADNLTSAPSQVTPATSGLASAIAPPDTQKATNMVEVVPFGDIDGAAVQLFVLTNKHGLIAKISNYGATLVELQTLDRDGKLADVTRGFEDLSGYRGEGNPYFGSTIGRVANRIKHATFQLGGKTIKLAANNGKHHLHGGLKGWDKVLWKALPAADQASVTLTYTSKDGDENYPGKVNATTVYTLTDENELRIEMSAETDQATPLNMAHHTYWNLAGPHSDSVQEHVLTLHAEKYTPGGADLVPTGEERSVAGSVFDFRSPKRIGKDLLAVGGTPVGYDHNFIIDGAPTQLRPVARLEDPETGRVLELSANQPGVQFYSGNFMDGTVSGRGVVHKQYSALCLESQMFPNSPSVPHWKDRVILKPGNKYRHVMVHKFTAK